MRKSPILPALLVLSLGLGGCEYVTKLTQQFGGDKTSAETKELKDQVAYLTREISTYKDEMLVKDVTISLYILQRAVEAYARDNQNHFPTAGSLAELQPIVNSYLPPKFEINSLYVEEVTSKPTGYLIVANVKDHKIVISNLKT